MADEVTVPNAATAVADASAAPSARRRAHPVLIVVIAIGLAVLIGWIIAGLPGLHAPDRLSLVLIMVSLTSGLLTLIFVIRALRRARSGGRANSGERTAVLISSLMTAIISIAQMVVVLHRLNP